MYMARLSMYVAFFAYLSGPFACVLSTMYDNSIYYHVCIELFCVCTGLFCVRIGLFCVCIGLFCVFIILVACLQGEDPLRERWGELSELVDAEVSLLQVCVWRGWEGGVQN